MNTVPVSEFLPTLRKLVNVPLPMVMEDAISRAVQEFLRRSMLVSFTRELGDVAIGTDYTLISDSELNATDDVFQCVETQWVTTTDLGTASTALLALNEDYQVKGKDVLGFLDSFTSVKALCVVETKTYATQFPEVLYTDWLDGICCGAASYLLMQPDSDWANPNLAAYNQRQFEQAIVDARRWALDANPDLGFQNPVRKRSFF